MYVLMIGGLLLAAGVILIIEWPNIREKPKKDRFVFLAILISGFILSVFLVFDPHRTGPTQMINHLFNLLWVVLY